MTGADSFRYYRKNAKYRDKQRTKREYQHTSIINKFWEKVREDIINKKGGVYIEKFGYFFVSLHPERGIFRNKYTHKNYINPETKSSFYYPVFIPEISMWNLTTYTMDRQFCQSFRKDISIKIKSGFKYLNFFTMLKSIFKNKFSYIKNE